MSRKKLLRDKKTLGGRFSYARELKGYNIKGLAEVMGCSSSHITGIELNKKSPSEYFLNDLEQKTGIRKEFIKTGQDQPLKEEYSSQQEEEQHEKVAELDSSPAQPDLSPVVDGFLKSFGEMVGHLAKRLDAVGSRLNALELAVKECQKWRQHYEKREETFPHKPAASAGDTKKKAM